MFNWQSISDCFGIYLIQYFFSLFTLHTNGTLLHLLHERNSILHLKGNLNWVTISNSTYCLMFYCSVLWCDCICYYYYCYSKVLFLYSISGLLYTFDMFLLTPLESRTGPGDIYIGGHKCYILCVCVCVCVWSIHYQCFRNFCTNAVCCTNHLSCCLQCYWRLCNIQWTMSTSEWV